MPNLPKQDKKCVVCWAAVSLREAHNDGLCEECRAAQSRKEKLRQLDRRKQKFGNDSVIWPTL